MLAATPICPKSATAPLNYVSSKVTDALYYRRNPAPGEEPTNVVTDAVQTEIINIRGLSNAEQTTFTVDTAGFQIIQHESLLNIEDFADEAKIKREYYAEVEQLLKDVTGATKIIFFDYTLRRRKHDAPEDFNPQNRGPGLRVHVDQTPKSGRDHIFQHGGADAERLNKNRIQIINVWRPLRVVQDAPLAYCDFRTVEAQDLVPVAMLGGPYDGEVYHLRANQAQKWYFYKDQTPSDVVLLKCYESEPGEGRAMVTPHSAFVDPAVPYGVPARESIEVRALVCYEPESETEGEATVE